MTFIAEGKELLKELLNEMDVSIPALYKKYSELTAVGGVSFSAFNVDPDFEYCVDGLAVVDISMIKPKKRKRYIKDIEPVAT